MKDNPEGLEWEVLDSIQVLVRLRTAYEWAIASDAERPDGGWPQPSSKKEAERALDELAALDECPMWGEMVEYLYEHQARCWWDD